jgi:hypothetical protein
MHDVPLLGLNQLFRGWQFFWFPTIWPKDTALVMVRLDIRKTTAYTTLPSTEKSAVTTDFLHIISSPSIQT